MRKLSLTLLFLLCCAIAAAQPAEPKVLVVVIDGLRPDYVRPDVMPNLYNMREIGFAGERHHAVFPTVTRVNSASLATGAYPRTHGLIGNNMFVEAVADSVSLSTGERENLLRMEAAFADGLLTVQTLSEYLAEHGKKLFAASSGSSGSGYLLNHRIGAGGLVHLDYVLPPSLEPVVQQTIGVSPKADTGPAIPQITWAIDAILEIGLDHLDADVLLLWVTEPDHTAHATGVGSPATLDALQQVDGEIGRLTAEIDRRGLGDRINLIFTADHGFSTQTGRTSISQLLIENGLKVGTTSSDVVLAGGAIHVRQDREMRIPQIIHLLQETDWVGPVFTRDGRDGTLPFSAIFWDHDRSADILTAYDWTDARNDFGFPGSVSGPGVAGHGSTSAFDVWTYFLMSGPAIKAGVTSNVPSGNVDIAPTALSILGLPVPAHMDGRVLKEAILGGPDPASVLVESEVLEAGRLAEGRRYRLQLMRSRVDGHAYVDETRVVR